MRDEREEDDVQRFGPCFRHRIDLVHPIDLVLIAASFCAWCDPGA